MSISPQKKRWNNEIKKKEGIPRSYPYFSGPRVKTSVVNRQYTGSQGDRVNWEDLLPYFGRWKRVSRCVTFHDTFIYFHNTDEGCLC